MNPLILGPLLEVGRTLIERFFPDQEARRKAEADFLKMAYEGELKTVVAQLEINAKEAAHPSIFVAGWRPAIGWTCAAALAYSFVLHPFLVWYTSSKGIAPPPQLDSSVLENVLWGMLGLGGLRTFEKTVGKTK